MPNGIFTGVVFLINPVLSESTINQLSKLLAENQAKSAQETGSENEITHIITDDWWTLGYKDIGTSLAKYPQFVTSSWVRNCVKYNTLFDAKYYSPDPSKIFSGLLVSTSQLPIADSEFIFGAFVALGGQWSKSFTPQVTHLITALPEGPKYLKAIEVDSNAIVVTPHWVDDCLKLRKRLPEHAYRFPSPLVLSPKFNVLTLDITEPENQPSKSKRFLEGLVFYFDKDISLEPKAFSIVQDQLIEAGAKLSKSFEDETPSCYICQYKSSRFYEKAFEKSIYIGTMTWVNYLISSRAFISPMKQLLYFPTPDTPSKGYDRLKIVISNYTEEAKQYLSGLLKKMGAEVLESLTSECTHLVCGIKLGHKYEEAQKLNIITVNHLWVEDSYKSWTFQAVTKSQYSHFPSGVNLEYLVSRTFYSPSDFPVLNSAEKPLVEFKPPSRKAASLASRALNELMKAQNLYEASTVVKPKRNITALPVPTKTKLTLEEPPKPINRIKRPMYQKGEYRINVRILFSKNKPGPEEKKQIRNIGGKIVEAVEDCTHLVAKTAGRTQKFLGAIALGRSIVVPEWVTDSIEEQQFLDGSHYSLKDSLFETEYAVSLEKSISRARTFRLLEGYEFALTPSVKPGHEIISSIITLGGGKVLSVFPTKRSISAIRAQATKLKPKLIIVGSIEDKSFLVSRLGSETFDFFPVFDPEFILLGTIRQELDFSSKHHLQIK